MKCIVCGSSLTPGQKKCTKCQSETLISQANFLFAFNDEDIKQIGKYYEAYEAYETCQKTQDAAPKETNRAETLKETLNPPHAPDFSQMTKNDVRALRQSSDPEDQYKLACVYFKGAGSAVKKNLSEAFKYFYKSAKQGNRDAQFMVAKCYENGYGTEVNAALALKWQRKTLNSEKPKATSSAKTKKTAVQQQRKSTSTTRRSPAQNTTRTTERTAEYDADSRSSSTPSPRTSPVFVEPHLRRPQRTLWQRTKDFFRHAFNVIRVVRAILASVLLGEGISFLLLRLIDTVIKKDVENMIRSAIFLAVGSLIFILLYRMKFRHLRNRGLLYRWLSREMVIVPILLTVTLVGGTLYFGLSPMVQQKTEESQSSLKYKVGELQLSQGLYSAARTTFEELGDYGDSAQMASTILAHFPSTLQKGDIIKFGTYEQDNNYDNGKEDIEWQVVYGSNYNKYASYVTLISKNALDYKYFDVMFWKKSSLREWLNNDFLNEAFTPEQQAVLDVTGGYNTDKVDIFVIGDKALFPEEILHTTPTVYARSKGAEDVNWCFRWTDSNATFNFNTIQVSYVDEAGQVQDDVPDGYFYIRPVIRLKIFAYENQLGYGDNSYTDLYNSDFSKFLKTYTGTYEANQGIACMDFTMTSCDKHGNIEADISFYAHKSNPKTPAGQYTVKGCITDFNKSNGSISIDLVGYKWINRPKGYEMPQMSITVDPQSITGGYQMNLTAVE